MDAADGIMLAVFLAILFFAIVVGEPIESFIGSPWGRDPVSATVNFEQDVSNRYIVGPNARDNTLQRWQYDDQKTQADNYLYRENRDLTALDLNIPMAENRKTQRLAPITWSDVGIVTRPEIGLASVPKEETHRIPDINSTPESMAIPTPTTEPIAQGNVMATTK